MGRPHFWSIVKPLEPADEESDRGRWTTDTISLTPMRLDLTNDQQFAAMERLSEQR
jgi:5'-nucleotidase